MQTYGRLPVAFVRGEGTRLWDSEGKEYLDFLTGLATVSLGHAHPAVADAIADQARTLLHVSNLYLNDVQPRARGAPRPAAHVRDRHAGTGLLREQRRRGQRVRDQARPPPRAGQRRPGALPRALRVQLVPRPHAHDARGDRAAPEAGDVPAAADRLPPGRVRRRRRAARPRWTSASARSCSNRSRGRAGSSRRRPATSRRCAALCDEREALLLVDEVQTGLGRTGRWFGFEHGGDVRPDVVTMAKALGNGVPIGACWARRDVAAAFKPGDHATTFGGQPLAARAALAVLDVMEQENVPALAATQGKRLTAALLELPGVADVRGARAADRGRARPPGIEAGPVATRVSRRGTGRQRGDADRRCASPHRCS